MKNIEEKGDCSNCSIKVDCFGPLTDDELKILDSTHVCIKYKKGEVILKQGSIVSQILYVKQGLTKVYKEIDDTNNFILNFSPSGTLIGLPSIFGKDVSPYSVTAVEDTIICSLGKSYIESFIQQNVKFATAIITTINNCNLYNVGKIVSLTQKHLPGRIAEVLLLLSNDIYQSEEFYLSLTRKDIAEYTGMSVMSVVRILKDFGADNIIKFSGKNLKILNMKSLIEISEKG